MMGLLALINHVINFFAPAVWLALLLPLAGRLFVTKNVQTSGFSRQAALLFVVGSVVLVLGLIIFGRDGKLLTYLSLVVVGATIQTVTSRR